jgi:Ion channel
MATPRGQLRRRGGYGLVLLLVGTAVVFRMAAGGGGVARFVAIALQAATVVAVVRAAGAPHAAARAAAVLAAAVAVVSGAVLVVHGTVPEAPAAIVTLVLVAVGPGVLAAGLIRDLRAEGAVTVRTLAGVLSIYLLLGVFFSFVYGAVQAIDPDAMFAGRPDATPSEQVYFSFVTLCTVGFGDFVPAGGVARSFAVAEMLIGQIYLVTVVALIVANMGIRRAPT